MKIEKIDHVCMLVSDMEKAKNFFSELFETKFDDFGTLEEQDAASIMKFKNLNLIN